MVHSARVASRAIFLLHVLGFLFLMQLGFAESQPHLRHRFSSVTRSTSSASTKSEPTNFYGNTTQGRNLQGSGIIDVSLSFSSNQSLPAQDELDDSTGSMDDTSDHGNERLHAKQEALSTNTADVGPFFIGPEIDVVSTPFEYSQEDISATKRIVGGYDAEPHSFHSMLLVRYGGGWRWAGCGATLVSNCHVISAAHCFADASTSPVAVYVNAHQPYRDNGNLPFHFSSVQQVIRHEKYNETTNANDVAVLKMAQCLNTTEFPPAFPAAPESIVDMDLQTSILGFGKQSETGSMFNNVESLQMAQVPLISRQVCQELYGDRIKPDMYCAGFTEGGADACQGDSGSSMTYIDANSGNTILLGVISWGVGCGRSQSPGVYASVRYHYNWLAKQICTSQDTLVDWCDNYTSTKAPTPSFLPSTFPSGVPFTQPPNASSIASPIMQSITPSAPPTAPLTPPTYTPSLAGATGASATRTPTTTDAPLAKPTPSSQKNIGKQQQQRSSDVYAGSVVLEDYTPIGTSSPATTDSKTMVSDLAKRQDLQHNTDRSIFWDDTGCKEPDHQCWIGHECCSGVCGRLLGESLPTCASTGIVTGATRKHTSGIQVQEADGNR